MTADPLVDTFARLPHRTFPGGRDELVAAVLEHEVEVLATGALALIDAAPTQTEAFLDAIEHQED